VTTAGRTVFRALAFRNYQLLLLPIAGYASDLMPRRRLLAITQCVLAVLAIALGVLLLTGATQFWQVSCSPR
jgi:hypothetical protein